MKDFNALALALLKRSPLLPQRIRSLQPLVGDASTRQYIRIFLDSAWAPASSPPESAILMVLNSAPGSLGAVSEGKTQDDTFVELGTFLSQHQYPVPQIYVDGRADGALLVEDIGDISLAQVAATPKIAAEMKLGADPVLTLYRNAVGLLAQLQNIPRDESCIAYRRSPPQEKYLSEAREFLDHLARPQGFPPASEDLVQPLLMAICQRVLQHPLRLSHYDFASHNLMLRPSGKLAVLDFQETCLCSTVRDLVSLINDRDVDFTLGRERHQTLYQQASALLGTQERFREWYLEYLLHWCFRVSGRYAMLAQHRGIERYRQWIPGALRRLGRTLREAQSFIPEITVALPPLLSFSEDIRTGFERDWL